MAGRPSERQFGIPLGKMIGSSPGHDPERHNENDGNTKDDRPSS